MDMDSWIFTRFAIINTFLINTFLAFRLIYFQTPQTFIIFLSVEWVKVRVEYKELLNKFFHF